ncbi:glycerophosphodiester phosphodiesterase family protein [Prosthecomicrobium pneumaticum]|uniref:Glycerophosphoryl diester phosphodiesterase n=1 Tax=Prosthecomicrobium pneumaticum TaxID=81895 RepID=A0A7W9FJZ9_9HYPH|nr:glycerophosphoryl diester phosphodiesterase [Prosthecomicrobium pneumaticum]
MTDDFRAEFVRRHGWPERAALAPLAIAHRGASAHANENTRAAFEKAATLGAAMWELDVRLSRDGVPVVSHDATLALADGRRVTIADHDWAALAGVALARGGTMPAFAAIVDLAAEAGCGLYVEVKERAAAGAALAVLSAGAAPFAAIGSFDHDTVRDLVAARSRFPVSVLVRMAEDPFAAAEATGAAIIHLCWERDGADPDRLVTDALIARAAAAELGVVLWHEERRDVLDRLMAKPVLGICTDKPEMMNRYRPDPALPIGVVCHRGMAALAPENTLHAARLAFDQGFQTVELDVHQLADGTIAVLHDATLDRTTSGRGPVAALDRAALHGVSAGLWFDPFFAGEGLPEFGEVLAAAGPDGGLYVEVKAGDAAAIVAMVEAAGALPRSFFWSPDPAIRAALRALGPKVRLMAQRTPYPSLDAAIAAEGAAIVEFDPDCDDLGEIAACRTQGAEAMIKYFGADPAEMARLIRLRPDRMNLDRPDIFLAAYRAVLAALG